MSRRQFIVFLILLVAIIVSLIVVPVGRRHAAGRIEAANAAIGQAVHVSPASQPAEASGPRRVHPPAKPGELLATTIKQLGNFDYEADKKIPEDVRQLSGAQVHLAGFMIITNESEHMHEFALVPDLFTCCYGQPPAIQHVVMVTCPKDQPADYSMDQITVEGTLTVKELKEEGYVTSLFQVAARNIITPK
jgi:hypothetical protein